MNTWDGVWYGQYKQDKYAWEHFFKNRTEPGVFLDVGASDGVRFSNSYAFEQMGWTGLCVEARESAAIKCKQARPGSVVENVAIAAKTGMVQFMEIEGYGEGLSGVVDEYDPRHVSRIRQDVKHPDCKSPVPRVYSVQSVPLQDLLDKHGLKHIHYFSLDVEGSELTVLKSIDWSCTTIDVIDVEVNYDTAPIRDFLLPLGYSFHSAVGCDHFYVREPTST